MNSEHYRLEALKLAVSVPSEKKYVEVAEIFYQWIMQDKVKAEEESKQAQLPQYKIPPNQAV